ncbi:hypothetical protein LEM8419_01827 [Neolewinella maritima]|uniref:Aminoglycoside phosphotransferase domain-containing protein n=1 Tax=Neolewinella maritima TaxID=1383882 RepID=A0ABM9B1H4_9BACT|nr:phosphotransferase [Neolewinella maritima]CAH1000693.1 hypothetical protein LEM8419_01827 [Neolewinella maritima]
MDQQHIDRLRQHPTLADAEVVETHISWLLLLPEDVYKMKKNVRFSFLDFSTPAKRKYYCERELQLNRRLAPELYRRVVGVNPTLSTALTFGPPVPQSVDYAVAMRRIDRRWEMEALLNRDAVSPADIDRIAERLAAFHAGVVLTDALFNPIEVLDRLTDILRYADRLEPLIGPTGLDEIRAGISVARSVLRAFHARFHQRAVDGFTVDGHGDLHTGNIFLEHGRPILFDCLEFADDLRRIDVLDEVAFLYVDLEARGRTDLAERFAASYRRGTASAPAEEDELIFSFYRFYRVNVALKVTAIKISHSPKDAPAELTERLHRYLDLHRKYAGRLRESVPTHDPLLAGTRPASMSN